MIFYVPFMCYHGLNVCVLVLKLQLHEEIEDGTLVERIAFYQRANKEVAIICNHQRSVSKSHESQMTRLNEKIDELKSQMEELKADLSKAKKRKPLGYDKEGKQKRGLAPEAFEKKIAMLEGKIEKMEMDKNIKDDLKTVALGTSKIKYLDPRITIAWCKRHEVPFEKISTNLLLRNLNGQRRSTQNSDSRAALAAMFQSV